MPTRSEVRAQMDKNTHLIDIVPTQDLISLWEEKTGRKFDDLVETGVTFAANYTATALDVNVARKLINELGYDGRVVTKIVDGKSYVIFKGFAGKRSILTGTRYLANNPKVIDLAIGTRGVGNTILSGARLTVFLVVPLTVAQHLMADEKTMFQLVGNVAMDLTKIGIATVLAGAAASTTAAFTTFALGPLVVAIVVGIAASVALNYIDDKYGITDKLVSAMEEAHDNTFGALGRMINRLENILQWQALNGVPVGKGIFY
ncbi:hypothetical protein [Aurantivibrio plasticivorans]